MMPVHCSISQLWENVWLALNDELNTLTCGFILRIGKRMSCLKRDAMLCRTKRELDLLMNLSSENNVCMCTLPINMV